MGEAAVPVGPPGSADGRGVIYYGTVLEVNGELWMWYLGMGDQDPDRHYRVCFAKSQDGKTWEKPDLEAVEYGGNRHNNLVDLDQGKFSVAGCVVYYEPEDADPHRRFKMLFTGAKYPAPMESTGRNRRTIREGRSSSSRKAASNGTAPIT
jgi:hypothetical protein